jgi:carbamoyltransferase
MTAILGISAYYHDSAAALVLDGRIVAAAQEERFSRNKHDAAFPAQAVAYCLREAGIGMKDVDYVVFYEKPFPKFERLLETYLAFVPRGWPNFARSLPSWLKEKLPLRRSLRRSLGSDCRAPLLFLEHHESHAASAFFPSPFDEAAILTLDGVGEWATATRGTGAGNRICLTDEIRFPHSLGLLYSAFTYYCGFKVNGGEYKLMGLAPYGKPVYRDVILRHLIDLKPDGSFWLEMKYFNYCHGLTMTSRAFHRLFGAPPRRPESTLEQRHMDLAASVQAVTEEVVLRLGIDLHRHTRKKYLVLAGGVALNCVVNGRLFREGPYEDIWVQPAAGDAGGALGAAQFVWHQLLGRPRRPDGRDAQQGSFLGPACDDEELAHFLRRSGTAHHRFEDEGALAGHTAELLADQKVVGWFQGRMEFGPRALGNRSILADPRSPQMQAVLNEKIKNRETFRPFAPAVLRGEAHRWFEMTPDQDSPYMQFVAPVRPDRRIPAVTHVDGSARVQTVDEERNPRFHQVLRAFQEQTGCPVLVNTSFNVRGEPIVCTSQEAYRCFRATDMDALVLGNCVVHKGALAPSVEAVREEYLAEFVLD